VHLVGDVADLVDRALEPAAGRVGALAA
jgi:hypothetical protein